MAVRAATRTEVGTSVATAHATSTADKPSDKVFSGRPKRDTERAENGDDNKSSLHMVWLMA